MLVFSRPTAPTTAPAPRRWAMTGALGGALLALLVFMPAAWLAQMVERASGGQVVLAQARGTLWTGSAQLVLTGGFLSQDRAALPGRLHWRLRPHWQDWQGLNAQLRLDCCTRAPLDVSAQVGWSGLQVQIQDHHSDWPAAVLTGLGTPWNTIALQGQLQLRTQALTLSLAHGRLQMQGHVELDALAMSSRLSTLRPMGSYRLELRGGDTPSLALQTLSGHLLLQGQGQWVGQRLRFNGQAHAREGDEAPLANLLNILGRRKGAYSIITLG